MNSKSICLPAREGTSRSRLLFFAILSACVVPLGVAFLVPEVASIEIPPAVEKKEVSLKKSFVEVEHLFAARCGKCHGIPDPAKPTQAKPDCTKGFSKEELAEAQKYMANVRDGKSLYESYCDRCHALIAPGSHTADYWSKNLCTSDECMVKKRLNGDEEQQLLLYLSSHAKKN